MALEVELGFFEKHRTEWLDRHQGKFALIKGEEVAGFFDSAETAFENGVDKWGNVPMLVKRVVSKDSQQSIPALFFGLANVHP